MELRVKLRIQHFVLDFPVAVLKGWNSKNMRIWISCSGNENPLTEPGEMCALSNNVCEVCEMKPLELHLLCYANVVWCL
uniref:Uncharacterized protein n=1 Tax=Anguilla anguilla TaxID=7936 RepID=A0A0E9WE04_ANGAN